MMRYGAIMRRCGTRCKVGRMSAAGDQGEAWEAWQEVEKRDKTSVAARGANRGARRGRERDFHNIFLIRPCFLSYLDLLTVLHLQLLL